MAVQARYNLFARGVHAATEMISFAKLRDSKDSGVALGRLELSVMEIVWRRGESSVRDVISKLARPRAYTTVMTTLDRLYKKNLLERRKAERAFLYSPRCSRDDWERERADSLLAGFFSRSEPSRDLLISCLVDAAGQYDDALLEELEKKIRAKRKELLQRNGR
jgi:predicted transcriptional regulator